MRKSLTFEECMRKLLPSHTGLLSHVNMFSCSFRQQVFVSCFDSMGFPPIPEWAVVPGNQLSYN